MKKPAIVLMSKIPYPGITKTRLMTKMSGEECAVFHLACLSDTCKSVSDVCVTSYFYYSGGNPEYFKKYKLSSLKLHGLDLVGWKDDCMKDFIMRPQKGRDLGERLYMITRQVLTDHDGVIIMGTDIPEVSFEVISDALKLLTKKDVVIGPATDGGYYLLGVKKACSYLFDKIPWGTPSVLEMTLQAVYANNLSVDLLDYKDDIDTWDDLINLYHRFSCQASEEREASKAYQYAELMVKKYGQ